MDNVRKLCKIVRTADIPEMTNTGIVPYQPDDVVNCRLRVYIRDALDEARWIYFSGEHVRAYLLNHENLEEEGYIVSWDDETYILLGPGDNPMKPLPVKCLGSAILE